MDLKEVLPTPEELFACKELKSLKTDANFKFLIKSGYEHIDRASATSGAREEGEESMQEG